MIDSSEDTLNPIIAFREKGFRRPRLSAFLRFPL